MADRKQQLPWDQRAPRVVIIGDLILDEYLEGDVSRISPEAPVPVHLVERTVLTAGGAANVARNVILAGGTPLLVGVLGEDEAARSLATILKNDGLDTHQILTVEDRPTVKKTRVSAANQQLVRIDWETVLPLPDDVQDRIFDTVAASQWDCLVISDYGKGCLSEALLARLLSLAEDRQLPSLVDPKGRDFGKYRGATLISPNLSEAYDALGWDQSHEIAAEKLADGLQNRYGLKNVLVTMGAQGMFLKTDPALQPVRTHHLPAEAREVFDVSGAGDTVVGILSLGLGSGADLPFAMELANTAAGCVVEKWGTQPITRDELIVAMNDAPFPFEFHTKGKILEIEHLIKVIGKRESRTRSVVFTNGCFDLLHAGHVDYLERAKEKGDLLVVAVNDDESVKRLKGPTRPVNELKDRMRVLGSLQAVDFVTSFGEDTPAALIDRVQPDVLIKGADWDVEKIAGGKTVKAYGGSVETVELVEGISTTTLIERIKGS